MSMQQGNLNLNWKTNTTFMAYLQDEDIFDFNGQKVGVMYKKYKEVEDGLIKCKNRLIELGEIKVPKTQEQIIQEQTEMLAQQQAILNQMIEKLGVKDGFNTTNNEPDTKGKTTTSNTNGNKSTSKNKSSNDK